MLRRNLGLDFRAFCITDNPNGISSAFEILTPLMPNVAGWWNKVSVFSKEMPGGIILYLDLDLVITGDLTEVIQYAVTEISTKSQIACFSDAIRWMNTKFNSSMMVFRSGSLDLIYQKFCAEYPAIKDFEGGDQVWTAPQLSRVTYLDERFPGFKKSVKFDIATGFDGHTISLPKYLPIGTLLLDFHGQPKPHQLSEWAPVKDNWR